MSWCFRWLSHWLLWALHGLGAVLGGWCFWHFGGVPPQLLAHAALAGVSQRCAGFGGPCRAHGGRALRLWWGRRYLPAWEGAEHSLEAAQAQGHGILFLTPHLGCLKSPPGPMPSSSGRSQGGR